VLLAASDVPGGVLAASLGADGSGGDLLIVPGGGSRNPATTDTIDQNLHTLQMKGREVFRFAARVMERASRQVATAANLSIDDVKLIIPHQANSRIIESAMKSLGMTNGRLYCNLDRYGNTSAGSIPIALCEAVEDDRVHPGDHLILVGFGGGLTWGAALIEWGAPLSRARPSRVWGFWLGLRMGWARVESSFRRAWRWIEGLFVTPRGSSEKAKERAERSDEAEPTEPAEPAQLPEPEHPEGDDGDVSE
jgi:3-oxoacyl-[acyl-carrier-protein] synthase-3